MLGIFFCVPHLLFGDGVDLTDLSIEELMNLEITTILKEEKKVKDIPASIYIITKEDIKRSGATSIPELLRMVPGVDVAQINSHLWAITIRGFNDEYSNKLLVLIDGRSVYYPLFSGVCWDKQDLVLEDIERIEIIRGPGASIWGANAVNGVINIVTKNSKDTQGVYVSALAGNFHRGISSFRYGGRLKDNLTYRVYLKSREIGNTYKKQGGRSPDDWRDLRGGFRVDLSPSLKDSLMISGDIFHKHTGHLISYEDLNFPYYHSFEDDSREGGFNINTRYEHKIGKNKLTLTSYIDRTTYDDPISNWKVFTLDGEIRYEHKLSRHDIIMGVGGRLIDTEFDGVFSFDFDPHSKRSYIGSAFFQDNISVYRDKLFFMVGGKLEKHSLVSPKILPTARLLYKINKDHTLWAAVSKSIRTPSMGERYIVIRKLLSGPNYPIVLSMYGNKHVKLERVNSYEMGYRGSINTNLSFDISLFANEYRDIPDMYIPNFPPATFGFVGNYLEGESYGTEMTLKSKLYDRVKLYLGYSYKKIFLHNKSPYQNFLIGEKLEHESPESTVTLTSYIDIKKNLSLNMFFRYVSGLNSINVDPYFSGDMALNWQVNEKLRLKFVVENMFDPRHTEFGPHFLDPYVTEIPRKYYIKVEYSF
ncbi:TonB-dependent receptor plug domain-containing protein [Desulfothermus okinawensis JCM 13304]